MNSGTLKIALAFVSTMLATAAWATGTDNTHTIAVSSSVSTSCVVTSGSLGFGPYDPVGANATAGTGDIVGTGAFTLKCTKGAAVTVTMNNGANYGLGPGGAAQRSMKANTSDYLSYTLYQPVGFAPTPSNTAGTCATASTAWDATAGGTFSFTSGSAATNNVSVCGKVVGAQDVAAGSYNDTVTMTVNF